MKLLLHYQGINRPGKDLPADSFDVQGSDLAFGLKELGHEVYSVPYFEYASKIESYNNIRPDLVISIGSWKFAIPMIVDPMVCGLKVLPNLVSDGWVDPYYQKILNKLPILIVPSFWVKDVFIRDGVTNPDIFVIKESVNTHFYTPSSNIKEVKASREKLGIHADEIMIFIMGGEIQSKGGYQVIEAIKRLKNKKIKLVCKVRPDNKSVENDQKFINSSGISDQIILINKDLSQEEIRLLFQSCDIYAAPSQNEGFGRPHVEAQSCGKPVITIAATGAGENVKHLQTGYIAKVKKILKRKEDTIFDPYRKQNMVMNFDPAIEVSFIVDIDDMANGINLLLDKELREKMGQEGRKNAVLNYDSKIIATQFDDVLRRFIS